MGRAARLLCGTDGAGKNAANVFSWRFVSRVFDRSSSQRMVEENTPGAIDCLSDSRGFPEKPNLKPYSSMT